MTRETHWSLTRNISSTSWVEPARRFLSWNNLTLLEFNQLNGSWVESTRRFLSWINLTLELNQFDASWVESTFGSWASRGKQGNPVSITFNGYKDEVWPRFSTVFLTVYFSSKSHCRENELVQPFPSIALCFPPDIRSPASHQLIWTTPFSLNQPTITVHPPIPDTVMKQFLADDAAQAFSHFVGLHGCWFGISRVRFHCMSLWGDHLKGRAGFTICKRGSYVTLGKACRGKDSMEPNTLLLNNQEVECWPKKWEQLFNVHNPGLISGLACLPDMWVLITGACPK